MPESATVHSGSSSDPLERRPARATAGRDLRIYLAGQVGSTFGTAFTAVAVAVVAVQWFAATPLQIGLLAAAATVPALVLGPVVGVLVDRARRPRRLLIGADLACAAALALLALGLASGHAGMATLIAFATATGLASLLTQTLFFTHLNSLGLDALAPARARLQAGTYTSGSIANAVVGPAIAVFGPVIALLVDAASYVFSAACLRRLRAPDHNAALDAAGEDTRAGLTRGIRTLLGGPLRPVIAYAVLTQIGFAGCLALRPLFLLDTLGLPVALVAAPGFCAAVLGIVGSLLASRALTAGRSAAALLARCWLAGTACLLLLPAAAGPPWLALTLACLGTGLPVMAGAAANVALVALFTEWIPEHVMGQVNAALIVLLTAATAAGPVLAGYIGGFTGVRGALVASAGLALLAAPLLAGLRARPGDAVGAAGTARAACAPGAAR